MKLTPNTAILPLLALMAATRIHHFGSSWSLPDASLAVFFLAGMYAKNRAWFAGLLVAAGLLDYVAINQFNVSDWCISPAYVFLIPTYGLMWLAGYFCRMRTALGKHDVVVSTGWVATATVAAFILSNASFFVFSGRYADMPAIDYSMAVSQYFPAYFAWAILYTLAGLAAVKVGQMLVAMSGRQKTA